MDTQENQLANLLLVHPDTKFRIDVRYEDIPIKGNCSAIDEDTDLATETWINDELSNGNIWAWCTIEVIAMHNGLRGNDYLGCCSYKSEKDFIDSNDYYPDMKHNACLELARELLRSEEILKSFKLE